MIKERKGGRPRSANAHGVVGIRISAQVLARLDSFRVERIPIRASRSQLFELAIVRLLDAAETDIATLFTK